jgi:hypothetical protein
MILRPLADLPPLERARDGIRNLVEEVASLQAGERVLILSEYGRVERELPDLIGETVKAVGGEYHVVWAEPIESPSQPAPPVLMAAMHAADKIIYNVPAGSPSDRLISPLARYFDKDEGPPRITNNFCSLEHIGSDHARFSWRTASAIYDLVEEIGFGGKTWRITTPGGTDIGGKIGQVSSRQAMLEGQKSPFSIVFPHRIHCPIGSVEASGVIAVDHCAIPPMRIENPPLVHIENDRVVRVEGGGEAEAYRKALEANEQRWGEAATYLDSWHSGLNPHAPNVTGFIGHGCSARMHFHIGRSDTYTSAGVIRHTFVVDRKTILDDGRLAILEDPAVQAVVGP